MNLWPVEHFFSRSVLIRPSADLEKGWEEKCSTGQRFICTEVTSYKIHTLANVYLFFNKLSGFKNNIFGQKSTHSIKKSFCFVITMSDSLSKRGYDFRK